MPHVGSRHAVICAIVLWVNTRADSRVSAVESVDLERIGTSRSFGTVARPLDFFASFNWDYLLLRCDVNAGIPFPTKQGNGPSSRGEEGKPGLFLNCDWTLGVPCEWRRVCRGTTWVASRVSRTLLKLKRESGISFEMPQWESASSRVEGRISRFFSRCGRKLGVPFELQRGPQGPALVSLGKSRLHASCEGASRDSSPVAAMAEVLIWCWGWNLRVLLQCWHGTRSSSGIYTGESGLVSCGDIQVRFPPEL